jgi:Zn-dependent M28 family amino/carboxypeptidase
MKQILFFIFLSFSFKLTAQPDDSLQIRKIYSAALTKGKAYGWLDYLCNNIGGRITGSPQAAAAVDYVKKELDQLQLNKVWKQEVMVPNWIRGEKEVAWIEQGGKNIPLNICALGGSIGTPTGGLKANVIEVNNFEELKNLGREKVSGKIIFINHPMNPESINTFSAYGEAGTYRYDGAVKAAQLGAAGVVVRSLNLSLDDFPHTGAMGYNDSTPKIPACAISTNDANKLSAALKQNKSIYLYFKTSCRKEKDVLSYNVIGEIKGTEFPDEIVLVGGHLDSWDLAQGAHDDGAGVVQSMEVLNIFKTLNIQPKRTIRCVAFMDEESTWTGPVLYAKMAKQESAKHIAAIESDAGGFSPRGFSFKGDTLKCLTVMKWKKLFTQYGLSDWDFGYGGSDINQLEDQGTLLIGFEPDSQRYFDYHHSANDTFDKVNRRELELGAASMAALTWMLSEYGVK